jgi:hypothetical protein
MMKQEAIGVLEFQRLSTFSFLFSLPALVYIPSSRLLVLVSFHPVSTLCQVIPVLWASKFVFQASALYIPYLFRRFLLDTLRKLVNEIVLF